VGTDAASYGGFRYPAEIINHCVWLYYRFPLSFREVEEMMLQRGIVVSHETVRQWCAKFGQTYANGLRRGRARPGDKWNLDEVFIKINGRIHGFRPIFFTIMKLVAWTTSPPRRRSLVDDLEVIGEERHEAVERGLALGCRGSRT
jgi:hypothetical protein